MKNTKITSFGAVVAFGAMILGSCSTEQNYHTASVLSPSDAVDMLYADDTDDTIQIATTDSWTASTNSDWITIDPASKSGSITYSYGTYAVAPIYLTTTVNTGSERRVGVVNIFINGTDDFSNTMNATFVQYPVLNVCNAARLAANAEKSLFYYILADSANQVTDTIAFNTRKSWTLTTSPATNKNVSTNTVTVQPTILQGSGGYTRVPLTIQKNTSTTDTLNTILYLKSSDVTTPVILRQYPKSTN